MKKGRARANLLWMRSMRQRRFFAIFFRMILISMALVTGGAPLLAQTPPTWTPITGNENNMIAYGNVYRNGILLSCPGYWVGSYGPGGIGTDCRSVGAVAADGSYFATIRGDSDGQTIRFMIYNGYSGQSYDATESFDFLADDLKVAFDLHFSEVVPTFSISGMVTKGGAGLANVVMSGLPGNPVTGTSGSYTAMVEQGWSGTVIPTLAGCSFTPSSREYEYVHANQDSQNYTLLGLLLPGDFNGDGVSDLVWRHYTTDGANVLWLMNAATAGIVAGEGDNEVEVEENDEVQGAGLKGEGEEENRGNDREGYFVGAGYYPAQDEVEDNCAATLPGGEGLSTAYPEPEYGGPFGAINIMSKVSLPALANNSWKICGTGDFNNDGYQDILWRYYGTGGSNAVWLMAGTDRTSSLAIPVQTDLKWEIVGTGDFNSDQKVDILWRNKSNGKNMVWLMNGLARSSILNLPTQTNLTWKIAGCGDFNGDGKVDILWRFQGAGGKNQVWLMNGTVRQATVNIRAETNLNWKIAGVGDFNKDGKPDIIWRNYSASGANRVWIMNNTTFVRTETLPAVADLYWKIEN